MKNGSSCRKPARWALAVFAALGVASVAIVSMAVVQVASAPCGFTVMSYNVRHCEGMDGKLDVARIAAVVNRARPRFAALQ